MQVGISRDTLPQAMAKKLPRYPIPVFLSFIYRHN